jgi:hypothetical protein
LLPPSGYQLASPRARRAASIAFGEGPRGFSLEASLTAWILRSCSSSSMGFPGTYAGRPWM